MKSKHPRLLSCRLVLVVGVSLFLSLQTFAEDPSPDLAPLVKLLTQVDDAQFQLDLLSGMKQGLQGRQSIQPPDGWPAAWEKLKKSESPEVRKAALLLALAFGEEQAATDLKILIADSRAPAAQRIAALEALLQHQTAGLEGLLLELLDDKELRLCALRGLAVCENKETPAELLKRYADFSPREKQEAIATLASRVSFAKVLLHAVAEKRIPADELSAFTARQLEMLKDEEITRLLHLHWGEVRQSSNQVKQRIASYKEQLAGLKTPDLRRGRLLYRKTCLQCHGLFEEGGEIGPNLTGSNRANLDYILENVLDPSAVVAREYRLQTFLLTDGRVISGMEVESSVRSITVQTATGRILLSREQIEEIRVSPLSMMPQGQFDKLTLEEIGDLLAYLASPVQVPLEE